MSDPEKLYYAAPSWDVISAGFRTNLLGEAGKAKMSETPVCDSARFTVYGYMNEPQEVIALEVSQGLERNLVKTRGERDDAREAVACLHAEQNGPPLIQHEAAWNAAMAKAEAVLVAARAASEGAEEPPCLGLDSVEKDIIATRAARAAEGGEGE